MKLVLANNQSKKFVAFHSGMQTEENVYDYSDYKSLLFHFEKGNAGVLNVQSGKQLDAYDGVYINGYMQTTEIAYALATVLDHLNIAYVDRELKNAPSHSKLTAYAKLSTKDVDIPMTYAGSAYALTIASKKGMLRSLALPLVVKRADADRGIDNFIFNTYEEIENLLSKAEDLSVWLVQEFIPNKGFYLLNITHDELNYGVFRTLQKRPDDRRELAHMYKPHGGSNARLIEKTDIPQVAITESLKAVKAMNRQIATVDLIYEDATNRARILEVNYNPQLITAPTFKERKQSVFLKAIKTIE